MIHVLHVLLGRFAHLNVPCLNHDDIIPAAILKENALYV